ncbi:phosphotransferase family protein [Nocardia australiensis]|uniref:phosphotransferase family protein n=1 Tax=Nocardia australiensis TaxID=2887191 RepID=UPI001D15CE2B|nr:phosphotransferase family protein [Nocardia australiensis]
MKPEFIDTPGQVRDEDAFDATAVHEWLSARVDGLADTPVVRQFPGGASNLTYQLSYPGRELILRRPPGGHRAASAHDMRREFRVQRGLKPVFPYVPAMLAFCADESVIGSEFYVMEKLEGLILRRDIPFIQRLRRQPTHVPGMRTRAEIIEYYSRTTGLPVHNWTFYEVYGLFRLAGVIQQLYRRFRDGGTHNPVFKDYWMFVGYLEWRCKQAMNGSGRSRS